MSFSPKHYHDGHQMRVAFVVREMRKNAEILVLDSMSRLKVITIPKEQVAEMPDLDFGARQERKMRTSLRRIAKKKGTTKKARTALKEVLS